MLYVKNTLHHIRRHDLEPIDVECLWVELTLKHKRLLFGLFYRPPNSDSVYFASIEDSIHIAIDTGIQEIIVTGDFNFDMYSRNLSGEIRNFCLQFSLTQTINEPIH